MKRFFALLLVLVLLFCSSALADDLTDLEKEYAGGWAMYATHGSAVYMNTLLFLDDYRVISHTMRYIDGKLASDNTSSGIWGEFSGGIIFSLAGESLKAYIHEDGVLTISFLNSSTGAGSYTKCPDMGYTFE